MDIGQSRLRNQADRSVRAFHAFLERPGFGGAIALWKADAIVGNAHVQTIMFDFEPSENRDLTETVSTIAHLSRFVIADLTNPRSIPQELTRIVPNLPSVAVQPIIRAPQDPYAMFGDLLRYPWVLKPYRYRSNESLLADLEKRVVGPAEAKAEKLTRGRKHPVRRRRSSSSDNV